MKKLRFFPTKSAEIVSPLSIDDLLFSLKNEVCIGNPYSLIFPLEENGGKIFRGYIGNNSFTIVRHNRFKRTISRPIIEGTISAGQNGSHIKLDFAVMKLHKIDQVIFFSLMLALIALLIVYSFMDLIYIAALLLVLLFCATIKISERVSFNVSVRKSLKKLKKMFCV